MEYETPVRSLYLKMRVFNNSEHVAKRVFHTGDFNIPTHFLNTGMDTGAVADQVFPGFFDIWNAPVRNRAAFGGFGRRIEPQLVTAYGKTNVEGFVKIRINTQDG